MIVSKLKFRIKYLNFYFINLSKKLLNFINHQFSDIKYLKTLKNNSSSLKNYSTVSFSQEGEDLILKRLFEGKKNGFYIDVGAHHPFRFSNTYLFYLNGWSGINIDAMPGSMSLFQKYRPRDTNLEIGVSFSEQNLTYHIFNETALNTFSVKEAELKNGYRGYYIEKSIQVITYPLSEIIKTYKPISKEIDFLSIDVEGLDFEVLKSNNWDEYKPEIILIESLRKDIEDLNQDEIYLFLKNNGYHFIAKTVNTLFFKRNK
jgi:FkbM family methyltransferase